MPECRANEEKLVALLGWFPFKTRKIINIMVLLISTIYAFTALGFYFWMVNRAVPCEETALYMGSTAPSEVYFEVIEGGLKDSINDQEDRKAA